MAFPSATAAAGSAADARRRGAGSGGWREPPEPWSGRVASERDAPDTLRLRSASGAARPIALPKLPALDRAGTLAAFVEAVRSGSEPETSGRRNLRTLALTFAAIRSATERRRVAISELLAELPEDLR